MRFIYVTALPLPTKKAYGYAVVKMCETLAARFDVVLVAPGNDGDRGNAVFDFYKTKRPFEIRFIPYRRGGTPRSAVGRRISFFLRKAAYYVSLFRHMQFQEGDIIYTRDLMSLAILRFKARRIFLELHYLSRLERFLRRLIFRAEKIIVVTSFLKHELCALGFPRERILVAPDAADLHEFAAVRETRRELRLRLGLPADRNIILYAGNLYPWKGVYDFAKAGELLTKELFVVVGGSDAELADFTRFIENQKIQNVRAVGFVRHEHIPLYLKAADILVLPNSAKKGISRYNTSPLKLFEYMAAGVPIVASDVPALREILTDESAFFAEPDSASALARGVQQLLSDKRLADRLAKQALRDVERYTWEKRVEKISDFITG